MDEANKRLEKIEKILKKKQKRRCYHEKCDEDKLVAFYCTRCATVYSCNLHFKGRSQTKKCPICQEKISRRWSIPV